MAGVFLLRECDDHGLELQQLVEGCGCSDPYEHDYSHCPPEGTGMFHELDEKGLLDEYLKLMFKSDMHGINEFLAEHDIAGRVIDHLYRGEVLE
jgi:hypothetical protein